MIDFVQKVTKAIVIISETQKQLVETTKQIADTQVDIKDAIVATNAKQDIANQSIEIKLGNFETMLKYVIAPLVAGILLLVGVKMGFQL